MYLKCKRDKAVLIFDWCKKKFGRSKFNHEYPQLLIFKSKNNTEKFKAYYNNETNKIAIFLGRCYSYEMLCRCVIHEYKHYLMDNKEYEKITNFLMKKYKCSRDDVYDMHPHEKKAYKFEDKWSGICYKELKDKLHKPSYK